MRKFRVLVLMMFMLPAVSALTGAFATSASAATQAISSPTSLASAKAIPDAPFPDCGDYFTLTRGNNTENVRVTGINLNYWGKGLKAAFASANGHAVGPYYGSNTITFSINTGSTSPTTIAVSLTNEEDTATLCSGDYYA